MSAVFGGGGDVMGPGDKGLKFTLADTFRLAWADPDLRQRIMFVFGVFAVFAFCIHVPVPMPGVAPSDIEEAVKNNGFLAMLGMMGGRALQRISIMALGLGPYITASIIMQILNAANPAWKKEMQEGGEYARRAQGKRTRYLTLALCAAQGWGLIKTLQVIPSVHATVTANPWIPYTTILFWTAGAMLMLWLGEQLTERGIGNGVSLMIFAGIVISFPATAQQIWTSIQNGTTAGWAGLVVIIMFVLSTWFITYFTIAQRRIPVQHIRRQFGTKAMGGATSYLPFSVVMVGVIPIIFAIALIQIPYQFLGWFPPGTQAHNVIQNIADFMNPNFTTWKGYLGILIYAGLIFFFSYFYTAVQFNVEDIANNLKRAGSFIPGIRPGKQTKDFLDGVISRITVVGAVFLAVVAISPYLLPLLINVRNVQLLFGTSLLILVSVALETMRQIEANILMKQYGQ